MSSPRRPWVRAGRYLWGGIALIALALLGLSSVLSAQSLESAETDAHQSAERDAAAVLLGELSPRLASDDIVGTERRDLLELVQARILVDDRVARVRIWTPDGGLIFSSAPRDDTSEIVAEDHLQFSQAAGGVPASVVVEATSTAGPLLQTFVPLRVPDGLAPYAVAQIDQRYGAIEAEANRIWRPVQVVLVVALGVSAVLFVLSFVVGRPARPVGEPRPMLEEGRVRDGEEPARAADERKMRDAEEPARAAEERRADAERRLEEASTPQVPPPPDVLARIDELELQLRAEVAEREHFAAEVQRLRSDLKDAELALAREGAAATEAEGARSAELVAKANQRAADAEKRAGHAEQRATDAAGRIAVSEARVSELETAARQAEERAASDAERARRDDESRSAADLRAAQRETNALKQKLAEVEASLADATAKLAERESATPESGAAAGLEVELVRAERDVATADLLRVRHELETLRDELDAARASIAEMEARRPDGIA